MAVPAHEMESDNSLVRAVQAGDLEAYSQLFTRHYPAVQQACARRMACPLEAEEIAQAAFVRALERIDQCRGERQFGGWIQIIARHMCVDALRARSRVVPRESPMSENHSDGNEPHDSILDAERTVEVRRALDSLPPRQRQAVEARAEGTGPSEIADDLGLSVGAVDSLILRGRRRLALAYQRVAGEGGATATATSATAAAAASVLAVFSIGSTRLMAGVAAAAEAGRDLVTPVAGAVAGAIMTVAVAVTGAGPATAPEPATAPSARPPAVVVSVPMPDPAGTIAGGGPATVTGAGGTAAGGTATAGASPSATGAGVPLTDLPALSALAPAAAAGAAVTGALGATPSTPSTAAGAAGAGGPGGPATGAPVTAGPAPAVDPAAVPPVVEPVTEPVTDVLDDTVPAVTETVDTVVDSAGDTVDDSLDAVTGLLPK